MIQQGLKTRILFCVNIKKAVNTSSPKVIYRFSYFVFLLSKPVQTIRAVRKVCR